MNLLIPRVVKGWPLGHLVRPFTSGFIDNRYGRRYASQPDAPFWSEAFSCFNLRPDCVEPKEKNFTGNHYLDGAFTHDHIDEAKDDYVHVRCNLMIKKPPIGGNPILDGEEVHVDEGDLWLCLASLERHSSTPISGGERIIFSFGALVSEDQVFKLLKQA
jgi:hypothetical protein